MGLQEKFELLCNSEKEFDFRDFGNLDCSQDAVYLIDSMDRMYELPAIQAIKKRAISLLALEKGDSVIEVGCGLGCDAEAMGEIVGSDGVVMGLDFSELMFNEARRRSKQTCVKYVIGNAEDINYPNDSFTASYADRLLISQKNVVKVVDELVRIVKPGGRVCMTDVDMESIVIFPFQDQLTDILKNRLREIVRNPFIGRELFHMLKLRGLVNLKIFPEAYIIRNFDLVNTMIDYPRIICDLYRAGKYTKEEALRIWQSFVDADADNTFLYGVTLFTAVGTKK